ncbi:hypothetical protein [Microtetraspora sp. NBRC 13810]|uniref:hypothetical protein n=1 Tax=Microtetraspora sp. NBRC 13810 TaxID=3030990 RepID=UPI002556D442|nr:hypothetical protein [Microtetraspora sp. NBRC 13810]
MLIEAALSGQATPPYEPVARRPPSARTCEPGDVLAGRATPYGPVAAPYGPGAALYRSGATL